MALRSNVSILKNPIEFLKGVGPLRAEVLAKELGIKTFGDLLFDFPFRYVDKTNFNMTNEIVQDGQIVQLKLTIISKERIGDKRRPRLSVIARDSSGFIELLWFQGAKWIASSIEIGKTYIVYGKVNVFKGKRSIPHPDMELLNTDNIAKLMRFDPIYRSTEKLDKKGLGAKARKSLLKNLFQKITSKEILENLPEFLLKKVNLTSRYEAIKWIHFPPSDQERNTAIKRLKFEELFYNQLALFQNKAIRKSKNKGFVFGIVGEKFNRFYKEKIPFELTGAQKRVLKEIRYDLGSGVQMNRLLQGDVGSGKTMVALMTMLIALDNGFQACMMAPTEILALQHYNTILEYVEGLGIRVAFLSGSVKGKKRKSLLDLLSRGEIDILIGTHALIENPVVFKNLGLAIIDEQHRFGVGQRAKLWKKNPDGLPHILVMTATPIPRTLAMTRYGDLDVSVIDELPPGRKQVQTFHKYDSARPDLYSFLESQIDKGRQIYIVYPLIEESEVLDLRNLQDGYERILHRFPRPKYQISIVHGRMKNDSKEMEMKRFSEGKTHIMVATTVIEVGVNIPNASVMVIENAERFGLSQLHQLRGRVGRGADQSFCILMSGSGVSKDALERLSTMVRTTDGFEIAEADLMLRGPGDITGTQQSGVVELKIANLLEDQEILKVARYFAMNIIKEDPLLAAEKNKTLKRHLSNQRSKIKNWSQIS
jgi:ATP-dependent DNA helicase RecG